jgi:hypothetical protein
MKLFQIFEQHNPKQQGNEYVANLEAIRQLRARDFVDALAQAKAGGIKWPIVQELQTRH